MSKREEALDKFNKILEDLYKEKIRNEDSLLEAERNLKAAKGRLCGVENLIRETEGIIAVLKDDRGL